MVQTALALLSLLSLTSANHFNTGTWKPAIWDSPSWRNTFDTTVLIGPIAESQIIFAWPSSVSCWNGSESKTFKMEGCTNAGTSVGYINNSFLKYNFTSLGQKAALVATMLYESSGFKENVSNMTGRKGQGTKAMLQFNYIYDYAWDQPELQDQLLKLRGGSRLYLNPPAIDKIPEDTQEAVRALVLPDQYTFGAAGWYLREKCDKEIHETLTKDRYDGFRTYVEECLEAGKVEPDRLEVWCKAIDALTPAGIPHPEQCSPK